MVWEMRRESGDGGPERRSPWGEAVCGEPQAHTQDMQCCVREVSQGAVKSTAGFRLFAKCGVLTLSNLHRKERYALHLTWRHLPNSLGFAGLRSASRCNWKTEMPVTGDHSDCVGYDRSKAAERN